MDKIYELLNMRALIRGRWGYRQLKKSDEEYREMLRNTVYPSFEELKKACAENDIFEPRAAWGYFKCRGDGNILKVKGPDGEIDFEFPRAATIPHIAISDYFRRDEDVVAFMVVSMGSKYMTECKRLHDNHDYQKYLLFHGLAAELTDSLAMYWHSHIRSELGFPDPPDMKPDDHFKKRYRGVRYGFGYSACPDLAMNKICCELIHADEIGVTLTESFMMIPEVTTCAIIIHNNAADYH
jgi:5-methyltetrahydrofolate--homocysteine methyltransferase